MSAGSDPVDAGSRGRLRPRIVTTRAEPGRLDSLLAAGGADVVHAALIAAERIVDPRALTPHLASADWVAATSRNGAAIVAEALAAGSRPIRATGARSADAGRHPRLAAVGRRTAAVLERAGLAVDVVPTRQTAADLVTALPDASAGTVVVVVRAEQTDGVLADGLRGRGYLVDEIVGYRTVARRPTAPELAACRSADVITFASGSAAASWTSLRVPTPTAVAIGPSTAARAESLGMHIDVIAAEHSVEGLAAAALAAAGLRS